MSDSYRWSRTTSFSALPERVERWRLDHEESSTEWKVVATYGKPLDIATIKTRFPFEQEIEMCQVMKEYFEKENQFETVSACPVCKSSIENSKKDFSVWKSNYLICLSCDHAYADLRPTQEATMRFYETQTLKPVYTDKSEVKLRVNQIYQPKLDWILKSYRAQFGRDARSIVDLGAGTGHFLSTAAEKRLAVGGLELNHQYREWAKETFELELSSSLSDLEASLSAPPDIITSFNVIEHFISPEELLEQYRRISGAETFFVIETPRYNSFTTAVQKNFTESIRGHVMPYEHTQLFTDSSLATLLFKSGFKVTCAWSFGQDLMELFCHVHLGVGPVKPEFIRHTFNTLQSCLDNANASDLLIYAGTIT